MTIARTVRETTTIRALAEHDEADAAFDEDDEILAQAGAHRAVIALLEALEGEVAP